MTNFIFKSARTDLQKIYQKLDMVQSELRHQRQDNIQILYLLNKIINNDKLQKQVDDFYDRPELDDK